MENTTATESHLITVDVAGSDESCLVLFTAPWYVEAHVGQQLIPVVDPCNLEYEVAGYRVAMDIVGGTYDCDGNEIPSMVEAFILESEGD